MSTLETLRGRGFERQDAPRAAYAGTNGDGSETYYVGDQNEAANGPGGEYITYPPTHPSQSRGDGLSVTTPGRIGSMRRDSHFAGTLPSRSYHEGRSLHDDDDDDDDDDGNSPAHIIPHDDNWDVDDHRFSRDYQFTIASPDEEMHGKAVALFDFARENENELPLIEGQVVLISYRHGQGWLVAQDPKTGESGLVPEEYVRLLRDIEGGLNGLMNGGGEPIVDSGEAKTPTQESQSQFPAKPTLNTSSGEYYVPVVSTFSTSREDFLAHRLGSPSLTTPTEISRRGSEALTSEAFGSAKKVDGAAKMDEVDEVDEKSKAMDERRPVQSKNATVKTTEVVSAKVPE
jgi:hypothetical protein